MIDRAGFDGEGQGVGVGGDSDGGDFDEFLFGVAAAEGRRSKSKSMIMIKRRTVLPLERDEADGGGLEEFAPVKVAGNFCEWVFVGSKAPGLEEGVAADPCFLGPADGEDDIAVLVGVLDDRITEIVFEAPARCDDDFLVAVEGLVAGANVEQIGVGGVGSD